MSKSKSKNTTKKTKIVGSQPFINASTGEYEVFNVMTIEERDFNFHKMWLTTLISQLDEMTNKKTKVAFYLLDNMSKKDNSIFVTYETIMTNLNVGRNTIADTIKALKSADFLREAGKSYYIINPNTTFYGGKNKRDNILIRYSELDNPEREEYVKRQKEMASRKIELRKLERYGLLKILGQDTESPITLKMNNEVLINMIVQEEGGVANEEVIDPAGTTK